MYTYIVQRTQIYLSDLDAKAPDRMARRTGRTRSQLIREAIEATYIDAPTPEAMEAALIQTAGAWRRGKGSATGAAWVEQRRRGRLARLHGA